MAVYTKLSEKDLNEFFSKYDLGSILNYEGIAEGIENTNYFIQTERGKFILTLYEKRVEEKDLPFFISLMKNLFDKNFISPEPIININGNYISEVLNKKAAVVSFLNGKAKKILILMIVFRLVLIQQNSTKLQKGYLAKEKISFLLIHGEEYITRLKKIAIKFIQTYQI